MGYLLQCLKKDGPSPADCSNCDLGRSIECTQRKADYVAPYRPKKFLIKIKRNSYGDVMTRSTNSRDEADEIIALDPKRRVLYQRVD